MVTAPAGSDRFSRPLTVDDAERIIAIDRAHTGHARRRFFESRLAAAAARPEDFIQVGVMCGGALRGYAIARILRGEFGRGDAIAVLDGVGVELVSQESGVGQALIEALAEGMRQRNVITVQSLVDWRNHDLTRFFGASGFELAPRLNLERSLSEPLDEMADD